MSLQMTEHIEIHATSKGQLNDLITEAEERLRPTASKRAVGIIVSRYSPYRYTVAPSDDVPFGITREISHS